MVQIGLFEAERPCDDGGPRSDFDHRNNIDSIIIILFR
jgi:hypothetical protein